MSTPMLTAALRARPHEPLPLEQPLEIAALPTPALVLDRAALTRNIDRMAAHATAHGKGLRPHAKTHKCPELSRRQLDAGAVGVCAAKVSEAFVLVHAGIEPVLITSPVTTPTKAAVVADLAAITEHLAIAVDSEAGLQQLLDALSGKQVNKLGVVIDFDIAMGRTGTRSNDEVRRLHERIETSPALHFVGFQHYAGHVMHVEGHGERATASLALWAQVQERIAELATGAIVPEVVTGCGTGTYDIDVAVPEITDMQVGSYVFMDEEYRRIGGQDSDRFTDFEVSLTVAATAISQPVANGITVDAGYKSMASDTVPPAVDELANTKFRFAGDEHGVLLSRESMQSVRLGDVIRLVTPHCDPTVNLHDYYWVMEEDGLVHSLWPITARGCTW